MPLTIGETLRDRYEIESLLGQGGMGAVYRARDLNLNVTVVVKENLIHTEEARRQFGREARILAGLRHPNLPRVTDFFFLPGQGQYLVMDYVGGEDLKHLLARQGPCAEAVALAWIRPVLHALEYLHSQSIIHRDVKPANIKRTPTGDIALVDFGLAKVYDPAQETTVGARGVTPGYASPEQYGQGRTDARSDVYSVAATLYALLTGQAPPDGLALVIAQIRLVPPRELNPDISPAVEAAVLQAMQGRPDDRFQTVAAFREALPEPASAPRAEVETRPQPTPAPSPTAQIPEEQPATVVVDRRPDSRPATDQPVIEKVETPPQPTPAPLPTLQIPEEMPATVVVDRRPDARPPTDQPAIETEETRRKRKEARPQPFTPPRKVRRITPARKVRPFAARLSRLPSWVWLAAGAVAALLVVIGLTLLLLLGKKGEKVVTPAGTRIEAFALFTSNRDGPAEVYGLTATGIERLTSTPGGDGCWSPVAERDGDILCTCGLEGKREICRLEAGRLVQVTHTPGHWESWSPFPERDGDILFTSDRDGKPEIYRLTSEGIAQVTHTPGGAGSWSPASESDGDILFTSNRDGNSEIYRLESDGLSQVTHTPGGGDSWAPFPEPDGDILFTSNRDGKAEIYRLGSDGIAQVTHTPGRGESWAPFSEPDGDILFTSNRDGKREIYRLDSGGTVRVTNTQGRAESWWER